MGKLLLAFQYVWAFPWTLLGICLGGLGLVTGGKAQRDGLVFEFHGGAVRWFLERLPNNVMAMTLGFTVIGLTESALDVSRDHERIHVAQFARWGPFMVPAYFVASLIARLQGKTAYRGNAFEVEAYTKAPINRPKIDPEETA